MDKPFPVYELDTNCKIINTDGKIEKQPEKTRKNLVRLPVVPRQQIKMMLSAAVVAKSAYLIASTWSPA